jgi:5'-nucleotidase
VLKFANTLERMLKILVSNDDSVHAPGIHLLAKELRKLGQVYVVAPLEEKSTTGHSLTIHKPLRILDLGHLGKNVFGVSGSPADCVYLGIREVLGGKMPDLVVSGINRGANLGQDVYYSGTVSAAREACILGIPSIAVSLDVEFARALPEKSLHYATAAKLTVQLIRKLMKHSELQVPHHTLLNFNVPDLPLKEVRGIHLARQGFRYYTGSVLRRVDHRGKDYYWLGGTYEGFREDQGSDCHTVADGYASLTPLKLDSTDFETMAGLAGVFELPAPASAPKRNVPHRVRLDPREAARRHAPRKKGKG